MIAALLLPFILGVTHCFETDHILAVATLNNSRNTPLKSLIARGASWGVGHSIPILFCGIVYIFFKFFILEGVPFNLELPVGCLLIGAGLYRIWALSKTETTNAVSKHFMMVGIIHGLAGSAGVVLIHFTNESDVFTQSLYLILFSIGAIIGMGSINILLSKVSEIFQHLKPLQLITPIISIIYGVIMIYNYV